MAYLIKSGDTLSKIAAANNTTVAALMKLNPQITDANKIYAGANLNLPASGSPAPTPAPAAKATAPAPAPAPAASDSGSQNNNITPPPATSVYKSSDAYKALTPDLQQLVDLGYSTFTGTPAQQQSFTDALNQAAAIADPYAKAQIAMFKAEYGVQIAKQSSDYAAQAAALNKTISDLNDTLKANTDELSLEQQADIAKATTGYQNDMLDVADQAAEKGITFGTGERSRALAESRTTDQYNDVIQSTNRTYNFQKAQLQLKAQQGDADAQAQLDKLNADNGFQLQSIGQAAEKVLGSAGIGDLNVPGYTPVGGQVGDVETQREQDIINGAKAGLSTGT